MTRRTVGDEGLAIFIRDDELIGSRIVYVNDAFAKMSGYRADQLIGHSAMLLAGARPDANGLASLVRPSRVEVRKFRPDGSAYDVEVRVERLNGGAVGAPQRVVVMQRQLGG